MNKKIIPLLLLSGSVFIAGCDQQTDTKASKPAPTINKQDAIAVVNGKYISKKVLADLEANIARQGNKQSIPKERLVDELIQRELLIQVAENKQLDKSPEIIEQLDNMRRALLSQAAVQDYLKTNPVTEEEIKAEYGKSATGADSSEYKARHILVKTEEDAKAIIAELDKGADFAKLAKEKSTGPSGANGGDLGWFSPSQMVAPFSETVVALEDDKYTPEAVKTQFGWHVILREGSRKRTAPALDVVRPQLEPFLQRQKIQTMLEDLRSKANVEILISTAEEKPEAAKVVAVEEKESTPTPVVEKTETIAAPVEDIEKATKETTKAVVVEEKESTPTPVAEKTETVEKTSEEVTKAVAVEKPAKTESE